MVKRECGTCGKCCEGWLESEILEMSEGHPCKFYSDECKCTIYENRPQDPCRDYECAWVEDETFPEWMKPDLVNVIITHSPHPTNENLSYYNIIEAGDKMNSKVLNWIFHWALQKNKNILYEVHGELHRFGNDEFVKTLDELVKNNKQK
jgi:hypothetical protein